MIWQHVLLARWQELDLCVYLIGSSILIYVCAFRLSCLGGLIPCPCLVCFQMCSSDLAVKALHRQWAGEADPWYLRLGAIPGQWDNLDLY